MCIYNIEMSIVMYLLCVVLYLIIDMPIPHLLFNLSDLLIQSLSPISQQQSVLLQKYSLLIKVILMTLIFFADPFQQLLDVAYTLLKVFI